MTTCATLQSDRREFLAFTGLTLQEFQLLLNAFTPACERRYPKDRTLAWIPIQKKKPNNSPDFLPYYPGKEVPHAAAY